MKKIIAALSILLLVGIVIASQLEWKSDLIFSHKFHHSEVEAECTACHPGAETSMSGKDDLLPEMETCYDCHDEEDTECSACHQQPDEPLVLPRVEAYSVKFNHKLHVSKEVACTVCHVGVQHKENVMDGMHLPTMATCMQCHETPESETGCLKCHDSSESLKPADHQVGWVENHGMAAESNATNCTSCHTEASCVDCHQGENVSGNTHPVQFILTHGMSFMVRESDCSTCHTSRQFCRDCHTVVNNVIPADHLVEWNKMHADAARADYDRCQVCHDAGGTLCAKCHE